MREQKGYIVVEVDVTDTDAYKSYTKLSVPTVAAFGGRYMALGATAPLEGEPPFPRAAIVEFDSVAKAQAFYESKRYQEAKERRSGAARVRMFLVEGAGG
ncbi:MAG: DUF1330 domain-containing protein [Alphaproteobacteria bacterium]